MFRVLCNPPTSLLAKLVQRCRRHEADSRQSFLVIEVEVKQTNSALLTNEPKATVGQCVPQMPVKAINFLELALGDGIGSRWSLFARRHSHMIVTAVGAISVTLPGNRPQSHHLFNLRCLLFRIDGDTLLKPLQPVVCLSSSNYSKFLDETPAARGNAYSEGAEEIMLEYGFKHLRDSGTRIGPPFNRDCHLRPLVPLVHRKPHPAVSARAAPSHQPSLRPRIANKYPPPARGNSRVGA